MVQGVITYLAEASSVRKYWYLDLIRTANMSAKDLKFKEYLTFSDLSINLETEEQIDRAESKGCDRRQFFKVDKDGFIYATYERPSTFTYGALPCQD